MTANQVSYWTLQEHARANRANEGLKQNELTEKHRSNTQNELLKLLDFVDNPYALGMYVGLGGLNPTTDKSSSSEKAISQLVDSVTSLNGNSSSFNLGKLFGTKIDNSLAKRGFTNRITDIIKNGGHQYV